jgi:glycogen operon protein
VVTAPGGVDTGVKPNRSWSDTVIYELHVKGFTEEHPLVPRHLRGTYLGLAHPAVIDYLLNLGVTAVELLPVHAFVDEPPLLKSGRHNYWGYASIGFFAPHPAYAARAGQEIAEFQTMVAALHAAGIEVILDVVYNHTAEGDVTGPTLSFRGIDAPAYYARGEKELDITGVGNTLDAGSPTVVRMVTDSLRYWAGEMGVDGFRFDLASALGRPGAGEFNRNATLLTAITTDPLLASTKLIAEPWDATGEGYRVGGFGTQWAEWNGRYRDTVREFWRGNTDIRDLAYRLSGSSDLYALSGRRPWDSINFITAHDGFTLRDMVSYENKHNEANGEENRDGTDDNRSANYGIEGEVPEDHPQYAEIIELRHKQARNLMATLLLSTGTPMMTAGDERLRTQGGNNNAYCQDNETSWLNWNDNEETDYFQIFTQRLLKLRRSHAALRQPDFFDGRITETGEPDLVWLREDGHIVTESDWFDPTRRTVAMWIDGENSHAVDATGEVISDNSWLLILHAGLEPITITLPAEEFGQEFEIVVDTRIPDGEPVAGHVHSPEDSFELDGRSLLLIRVTKE